MSKAAPFRIGFPLDRTRGWEFVLVYARRKGPHYQQWLGDTNKKRRVIPGFIDYKTGAHRVIDTGNKGFSKTKAFQFFHVADDQARNPSTWEWESDAAACALAAVVDQKHAPASAPVVLISCECNFGDGNLGFDHVILETVATHDSDDYNKDSLKKKWGAARQGATVGVSVLAIVLLEKDAELLTKALSKPDSNLPIGKPLETVPIVEPLKETTFEKLQKCKAEEWPYLVSVKENEMPLLAQALGIDPSIFTPKASYRRLLTIGLPFLFVALAAALVGGSSYLKALKHPSAQSIAMRHLAPVPADMASIAPADGLGHFAIDLTEVTNEAFAKWLNRANVVRTEDEVRQDGTVLAKIPKRFKSSDYWSGIEFRDGSYSSRQGFAKKPVIFVSWEGARRFCQASGKRLPSSPEWMLAAFGAGGHRPYPWGNEEPDCAQVVYGRWSDHDCASKDPGPADVRSTPGDRTPEGVFDLGGNVAEWVADDDDRGHRFVGTDWSRSVTPLRSTSQRLSHLNLPDGRPANVSEASNIGFRCVVSLASSGSTRIPLGMP